MVDFIAWDIYFVLMTVHMVGNCFRKGDDFDHFDFRGDAIPSTRELDLSEVRFSFVNDIGIHIWLSLSLLVVVALRMPETSDFIFKKYYL